MLRTRTTSTCRTTRVSASTRGGPSCDVARLHRRDSASSRTNRTTHNSLVSHHQRQHRISRPPSLPPCKRRRHMGYHNTRGNPTAGRNARILARENYCVSASPGRAGFSIFCQIITSPNLCGAYAKPTLGTHHPWKKIRLESGARRWRAWYSTAQSCGVRQVYSMH